VSDAEFRRAYYGDPADPASMEAAEDNRNVLYKVIRSYGNCMDEDEMLSVGMRAVWRALKGHQNDHPSGQKFTTSLTQFAIWECDREARQRGAERARGRKTEPLYDEAARDFARDDDEQEEDRDRMGLVRECMDLLPAHHRRIVELYFLQEKTFEEVGAAVGCCKETARRRVRLARRILRTLCRYQLRA
jgi:RNA polymerase sigma factor (sigma-70 family)